MAGSGSEVRKCPRAGYQSIINTIISNSTRPIPIEIIDRINTMTLHKSMPEGKLSYLVLFLVTIIGFYIYSNSFDVPFLFDDSANIQNPSLRISEISQNSLINAAAESTLRARPVANISFAINYYFGEYNVRGYHLVNVLIHIAASFFLYLLLSATLKLPVNREKYKNYPLLPIMAALLWLTHPLATQSVTYLVQRMNSMAAMFFVLSVLCYVQGRLRSGEDGNHQQKFDKWLWFASCLISGVLAIGSKEIAVTLPGVIFLYEWFFLQDLSWRWLRKKIPWLLALLVFLYCAAYFYLNGNPLQKVFSGYSYRHFTLLERVLTEFRVVIHYIELLIYPNPNRLVFDYNFPLSTSLFEPISTIVSLLALIGIFGIAVVLAKKERFLAFCLFWFFVNLVLESSVVSLEIIFEHRTYLPSMFLFAIFPAFLYRMRVNRNLANGVLLSVIVVFGYWTMERNMTWQNPIRFWQDSITKQPSKARVYNNLGVALYEANRFEEAADNFAHAFKLLPDFPEAYSNIGLVYYKENRFNEAENNYKKAIELRNYYIEANLNLATLYLDQQMYSEALALYRKLYGLIPEYSILNRELGHTLLRIGQVDGSLPYLEKAYKKLPRDIYLLLDRGEAFMRNGDLMESIKSYNEVLAVDVGNAAANYNLGLLLTATGKEEEALIHYRTVETHQSVDIPVLYNMGNLYLRLGDLEKAHSSYTKYISSSSLLANAYNNLGLVSIKEKDLSAAAANFQAALRITPDHSMASQNLARAQKEMQEKDGVR
jgi:tetratricopeptide (TPR) repeat protein